MQGENEVKLNWNAVENVSVKRNIWHRAMAFYGSGSTHISVHVFERNSTQFVKPYFFEDEKYLCFSLLWFF